MSTLDKLRGDIAKLKGFIAKPTTPKNLLPKFKVQLEKAEKALAAATPKKAAGRPSKNMSAKELAAHYRLKYKAPYGAGDIKKDADIPAMKKGKRTAKQSGKTYYEYRKNRTDKNAKHYPKLEDGGNLDGILGDVGDIQSVGGTDWSTADLTSHMDIANPMFAKGGDTSKKYSAWIGEKETAGYPVYARITGHSPITIGYFNSIKLAKARADKLNEYNNFAGGGIIEPVVSDIKGNLMGTTSFLLQIQGMRKPQDFIVYPISAENKNNKITIQSDTRIGIIDLNTGEGIMSASHASGAYFIHLQIDKKTAFKINNADLEKLKMKIFATAGKSVGMRNILSDNSGAANILSCGGGIKSTEHRANN